MARETNREREEVKENKGAVVEGVSINVMLDTCICVKFKSLVIEGIVKKP